MDTLKINKAKNKTTTNINAKKDDFFSENASFFPESSKIWEQHILKSLEKKEALDQFLTSWYQNKIFFFVGKNFFFSVARKAEGQATEKKKFCPTKK